MVNIEERLVKELGITLKQVQNVIKKRTNWRIKWWCIKKILRKINIFKKFKRKKRRRFKVNRWARKA